MATIRRMIGEIEAYLASQLKDSDSYWEREERCSLEELLAQLKTRRD